ncbi:MAG: GntR family transcriptional regulator [Alphaproteobacteria bacterium]
MARRPSKRVPRYREIAQIQRSELAGEVYSLGGLFPKELDLCERFSVSRFTIRNAMAELEAAGLVERRKAIGTIVKALEPATAYVQTLQTVEGLLQYAADTALDISEMIELQADAEWRVGSIWMKAPG